MNAKDSATLLIEELTKGLSLKQKAIVNRAWIFYQAQREQRREPWEIMLLKHHGPPPANEVEVVENWKPLLLRGIEYLLCRNREPYHLKDPNHLPPNVSLFTLVVAASIADGLIKEFSAPDGTKYYALTELGAIRAGELRDKELAG
jgi:hypothetical protein